MNQKELESYQQQLKGFPPEAVLAWAESAFTETVVLATSLGLEDQILMHMLAAKPLSIPAFTVDTGRLFQETHDLMEATQARYQLPIRLVSPDRVRVEAMLSQHGPNLFKNGPEWRAHCCYLRKVLPFCRALAGRKAWITGLRREQGPPRSKTKLIEWDPLFKLYKINPLWDWHEKQVWDFIRNHDVPVNALHEQDYTSIGCGSCTRAVKPGEGWRAGRWWWEGRDDIESGLHGSLGKTASTVQDLVSQPH